MKSMIVILSLLSTFVKAESFVVKTMDEFEGESMVFVPSFLKIKKGDEVTFEPANEGHTSQSLSIPKGAKAWSGNDGEKITVKFEEEGLYLFNCRNHGVMGMMGVIQAGEPVNENEMRAFYAKHKKDVVMNNDRLDKYLLKK